MALNRNTTYGARWAAPSTGHPQGAFINRTTPTSDDGSYLEEQWMNDISSLPEALINSAGITLNGLADEVGNSQYMEGLVEQVSGRSIVYDCAGPVNTYNLSVRSNQYGPQSYFDGMSVEFTANNTNTGSAQVNVNGLGNISIENTGSGGEIVANQATRLRYVASTGQFQLIFTIGTSRPVTTSQSSGGTPDQTFNTVNWQSAAFPTQTQANITYASAGPTAGEGFTFRMNNATASESEWIFSSAVGGDSMRITADGGTGATDAYIYGDLFTGPMGNQLVPNQSNFGAVYNNNGYQFLPGGLIIQWYETPSIPDGSEMFFVFHPMAFPTACLQATMCLAGGSVAANNPGISAIDSFTTIGASITNYSGRAVTFRVIAIGH